MITYNCDLCGKTMPATDLERYVVRIEVFAATDPLEVCDDDWLDDRREACEAQETCEQVYKRYRYDLCGRCRREYCKDPLFRGVMRRGPRDSDN